MRRIGFILFPGVSVMSFAVVSVFEFANLHGEAPVYDVRLLSEHGGPVRTSMGMNLETEALSKADHFDTLLVAGGTEPETAGPELLDLLRAAPTRSRRVGAICTGAFMLAQAGLLDGRRATTHWAYSRDLKQRYPAVRLDDDRIFINDGSVWTSAGMTAGVDLALALIEEDLGAEAARAIARKLVVYHRRAGGQSQFSALLELAPKSDRIQTALDYARQNLRTPLSVEQLARAANLSPRQFSRAFNAETGQSPAKAVENLRVEAARTLMEQSRHPIEVVARETGFADPDRMRRAFLRAFGQPPQVLRRNARAQTTA